MSLLTPSPNSKENNKWYFKVKGDLVISFGFDWSTNLQFIICLFWFQQYQSFSLIFVFKKWFKHVMNIGFEFIKLQTTKSTCILTFFLSSMGSLSRKDAWVILNFKIWKLFIWTGIIRKHPSFSSKG